MKDEYVANGIPFLRSQNVRPTRYDPEGLKFISPEFHLKLQKSALEPGDIVVVRSGSVGVACVIPESLPVANCSDLVIIKRPRGVFPSYGAFYLNAVVDSRIAAGRVGVALSHFNTKSVAKLPVPVPPLAEQVRIVAEVERRLSIVRGFESDLDANLKRARVLREEVLTRAFGGKKSVEAAS
jgi:type I restriction enzyme S subunit